MSSPPSFFLPSNAFHDRMVTIHEAEIIRQMRKVLRLKPEDAFIALDGKGHEYICRIAVLQRDVVRASVIENMVNTREPRIAVVLYPSLIRRERFATILEKCTELGVVSFIPTLATRSPYHDISPHLRDRWEAIIRESAEVARRGALPKLDSVTTLSDALASIPVDELVIALSTVQTEVKIPKDIATIIHGAKHIHLFLGPEGDYTEEEYGLLKTRGAIPFSLGPRIVRSETAAIAAATLFTSLQ